MAKKLLSDNFKECEKRFQLADIRFCKLNVFGLNIFYFLSKYDNICIHCNLQIAGSERKQEYLYSSSPEHIKSVKFAGRILNV